MGGDARTASSEEGAKSKRTNSRGEGAGQGLGQAKQYVLQYVVYIPDDMPRYHAPDAMPHGHAPRALLTPHTPCLTVRVVGMMLRGFGRSGFVLWISCTETSSSPCPSPGASMKKDSHVGIGGLGRDFVRLSAVMIYHVCHDSSDGVDSPVVGGERGAHK